MIGGCSGEGAGGEGALVCRRIHGQLADVLVRVEDDDVDFGREEAEEGDVCTQADGDAERRDLDLMANRRLL